MKTWNVFAKPSWYSGAIGHLVGVVNAHTKEEAMKLAASLAKFIIVQVANQTGHEAQWQSIALIKRWSQVRILSCPQVYTMNYDAVACRFCGNNNKTLIHDRIKNLFFVQCNCCACKTPDLKYALQAQLAWINAQTVIDSTRIDDDQNELSILGALHKVGKL